MKSYYRDDERIIPFAHVTLVTRNIGQQYIIVFMPGTHEEGALTDGAWLRGEKSERFLAEYTAWLDARDILSPRAEEEEGE